MFPQFIYFLDTRAVLLLFFIITYGKVLWTENIQMNIKICTWKNNCIEANIFMIH